MRNQSISGISNSVPRYSHESKAAGISIQSERTSAPRLIDYRSHAGDRFLPSLDHSQDALTHDVSTCEIWKFLTIDKMIAQFFIVVWTLWIRAVDGTATIRLSETDYVVQEVAGRQFSVMVLKEGRAETKVSVVVQVGSSQFCSQR